MLRHVGHETNGVAPPGPTRSVSYVGERNRMATIQVESNVAITVDRDTRDVLRNCLRSEAYLLEDFDGAITSSDAQAAHDALARAVYLVEMFDQLGWTDDDPYEQYEISVTPDWFVRWLRGHRDDLSESLADEDMLVPCTSAADEANNRGGHTQQDTIAMTKDEVLAYRRELNTIEALLERLDSAGASA
jgi:hypothetical protein